MLRPRSERTSVSSVPPQALETDPESGDRVAPTAHDRITMPEPTVLKQSLYAMMESEPAPPMLFTPALSLPTASVPMPAPVNVVETPALPPYPLASEVPKSAEPPPVSASDAKAKKTKKKKSAEKVAKTDKVAKLEMSSPAKAEARPVESPKTLAPSAPLPKVAEKSESRVPVLVAASGKADEEVDLSISHKFFTDGESMPPPPVEHHELEVEEKPAPLTKETIAHRTRLKQIVGGVVAAAAVFGLIAAGKVILGSKSADAMPSNEAALVKEAPDSKKAEAQPEAKKDEPKAAAIPVAAAPKDDAKPADSSDAKPTDSAKADDEKKDDAKSDEDKPKLSDADIKALKTKAAIAAEGGGQRGIDTAKAAIDADPSDGMMYMYLYTSYLSLGKGKEGQEALNDCVHHASKVSMGQCQAWGGK